ncbi:MAG: hypothetical protein M3Y17_05250 [Actinomycetota bacterium]|nr:hypothetical protein [Actinomycetota bacterium]
MHGPPSASEDTEVEDDHGVSAGQAGLEGVIGAEISLEDPPDARRQLSLQLLPAVMGRWSEIG